MGRVRVNGTSMRHSWWTRYLIALGTLGWLFQGPSPAFAGVLTPVPGSPFSTGISNVHGVAVNPAGTLLFLPNNTGTVIVFNVNAIGALTPVPGSPFPTDAPPGTLPYHVAVNPAGTFLFVSNIGSGALEGTVSVFSIGATGALTPVPGSPFPTGGTGANGVAVNPTGTFLFVANDFSSTVSVFSIGAAGALTPVPGSPFVAGVNPNFVSIHPAGTFLFVTYPLSVGVFRAVPALVFPDRIHTPWTAPISAVFDHSMTHAYEGPRAPGFGTVTAFTAERGTGVASPPPHYGSCNCLAGYPNVTAGRLFVNGNWFYSNPPYYLNYDSHPGIDYALSYGTPLYPAISGRVHYKNPSSRSTNAAGRHTLEIDPEDGSGYKVYYLHLATYPDPTRQILMWPVDYPTHSPTPCAVCAREGDWVDITRPDPIAYSGNWSGNSWSKGFGGAGTHLHFEVDLEVPIPGSKKTAKIPVDPYGWTWAGYKDPYAPPLGPKGAPANIPVNAPLWSDAVPDAGILIVQARANGILWSPGSHEAASFLLRGHPSSSGDLRPSVLSVLRGPSTQTTGFLPFTATTWPSGTYSLEQVTGGPAGMVFCGVNEGSTQALAPNTTTIFTLIFQTSCSDGGGGWTEVPPE